MIIKGGSRSNWRYFSKHLTNAKDNERVALVEVRGLAADNVRDAFREMDAVASGTRCKNFFYHADINPRDDEHLTAEQWQKAVDTLEQKLGLEDHSRFVIEHEKHGRVHRHVIWNRIDTETMTATSDSRNFAAHEKASRELEAAFGHKAVSNCVEREAAEKRQPRRPKDWETLRGSQTGVDPQQMKTEITELWRESDSGQAFKAAVENRGYLLCKGDRRDFCLVDAAGKEHSLGRRVEGVKAAEIRARLADIERDALPTVEEGKKRNIAGGRDTEEHARLRRVQLDKELAPYLRDRENPKADELAKAARRAERAKQYRERRESLRHHRRLARGSSMASRDALHDASTGLGRQAYTINEARDRAAHTPSLHDEMQPYVRAARNGQPLEPPATFFQRASAFARKTTREYSEAFKNMGKKVKESWTNYVESRANRHDQEPETGR